MARFTFNLPDIGEGIAEAEIVEWHVKVGDKVEEDGRLADMMTDKATVEMESPVAGTIVEIGGDVGDVISIGTPLVVIEVAGEIPDEVLEEQAELATGSPSSAEKPAPSTPPASPTPPPEPAPPPPPPAAVSPAPTPAPPAPRMAEPMPSASGGSGSSAKVLASPAVRARAKDLGIDLAEVRPQEDGRIRHSDLDAFIAYGATGGFSPAGKARPDEQVRVVGLRRRIAENMLASKRSIPHFTYVEECDVTELEKLRADLNEGRGSKPKLTILPLLITAMCRTLPDFAMINALYDDEAGVVTRHGAVHMGLATMTDAGLMVPVIRNAQSLNLWQLASEIRRLSEAARTGKARSDELSGSTMTVTSLGPLGGIASTPVINRPEVAILAPNRIVERPAFVPDEMGGERIARRKLMNLSISCDHRVVDGYDAAAFVQALKVLLEAPGRILAG